MRLLETDVYRSMGYFWGKSNHQQCNWLQYADDAAIIAKSQRAAQALTALFESWCSWSKMSLRLDKCLTFGMLKGETKFTQVLPNISSSQGPIPAVPMDDSFK